MPSTCGKIKIKNINDLIDKAKINDTKTPINTNKLIKLITENRKNSKKLSQTQTKTSNIKNETLIKANRATTTIKKLKIKDITPSQTRIDSYYKNCLKTYEVTAIKTELRTPTKNKKTMKKNAMNRRRKRLFINDGETETDSNEEILLKDICQDDDDKIVDHKRLDKLKTQSSNIENEKNNNYFTRACKRRKFIEGLYRDALEELHGSQNSAIKSERNASKTTTNVKDDNSVKSKTKKLNKVVLKDDKNEINSKEIDNIKIILISDDDEDNLIHSTQKEDLNAQQQSTSNLQNINISPIMTLRKNDRQKLSLSCRKLIKKSNVVNNLPEKVENNIITVANASTSIVLKDEETVKHLLPIPITTTSQNNLNQLEKSIKIDVKTATEKLSKSVPTKRIRKPRICPSYKIIEDTKFAVDAFSYGQIEGITHYFLTHYHADHYTGLTKKFSMPLYLSPITAKLIRAFIPVDEQFIHEIELNKPIQIDDIEITAIDANHCPGAIMLIFKLPNGRCYLHTGDFRASTEMESEPLLTPGGIHTIYLDTTYLSNKYAFKTQYESIENAKVLVRQFQDKYFDANILYVCGSYVIGKEKFWTALAKEFNWKAWTEKTRRKAIDAMQIPEIQAIICDNPEQANLHVISMGLLTYPNLFKYFQTYMNEYDCLLAIRPSGWEKNSKPKYSGRINVIGVEYSEHSSHNELKRFIRYMKPINVISTVPCGGGYNSTNTPKIPKQWYTNMPCVAEYDHQSTILDYFAKKTNDNVDDESKLQPTKTSDEGVKIKEEKKNIEILKESLNKNRKYNSYHEDVSSIKMNKSSENLCTNEGNDLLSDSVCYVENEPTVVYIVSDSD